MTGDDARLIERFLEMLAAEAGAAVNTIAAYRSDLEQASEVLAGGLSVADADAIVGRVVGVDLVEDRVTRVESVLQPQRTGQLRAGLIGGRRVAAGLGCLDGRAEPCFGGGRIVVVPEVVERGHDQDASPVSRLSAAPSRRAV